MTKWAAKEAAIRLLENRGKVDPNDLVEAARAKKHPCHEDFTWDVNHAAAERWRQQARELIRQVHFEVQVDDATERVVMYVPDDREESVFRSLPKVRSTVQAGDIIATEVAMLHGLASRVHGIAIAKSDLIGSGPVAKLRLIRDTAAELKEEFMG